MKYLKINCSFASLHFKNEKLYFLGRLLRFVDPTYLSNLLVWKKTC